MNKQLLCTIVCTHTRLPSGIIREDTVVHPCVRKVHSKIFSSSFFNNELVEILLLCFTIQVLHSVLSSHTKHFTQAHTRRLGIIYACQSRFGGAYI